MCQKAEVNDKKLWMDSSPNLKRSCMIHHIPHRCLCVSPELILTVIQVVTFESWPTNATRVQEVQRVTVSSSCASHQCGSIFFSLGYGDANTGNVESIE